MDRSSRWITSPEARLEVHRLRDASDAVLVGMARFSRVLEVDYADRVAVVQPGVTNLAVTQAVPIA